MTLRRLTYYVQYSIMITGGCRVVHPKGCRVVHPKGCRVVHPILYIQTYLYIRLIVLKTDWRYHKCKKEDLSS